MGALGGAPGIRRILSWRGLPASGVRIANGLKGSADGEKLAAGLGAERLGAVGL